MILIGFMGSGKTTIGKQLSRKLNKPFVDLDDYIVKTKNMTIPHIFSEYGEDTFREFEFQTLKELIDTNSIIATGGGIISTEKSCELLKNTSKKIIFLDADFDILYKRIQNDKNRPNAQQKYEDIKKLYLDRLPIYSNLADDTINT